MRRPQTVKFVVHCTLSDVATGFADLAQIYYLERSALQRTTFHRLIDGDYLALQLHQHNDRRPLSVRLARVLWVQGARFAVEPLIMDADEYVLLSQLLETTPLLELHVQDARSELIIRAAE
ncbi:MAG: hypothetical protein H8K06_02025 [Nitrospira sp.]|uniref:PilZ domain-containing protein n=1 Tax=Nitrospira defluvii TaxID=330214 RepID=A0ABM8RGB3_9BACT|nr:hypothetical protein [Nitrospira sp.]CAE6751249.1 conserved hypothetical protein [Nitrospira defluvii]